VRERISLLSVPYPYHFQVVSHPHRNRFPKPPPFEEKKRLLEDLAVSPLVLLAVLGDGLVPRPLVVDKLLVLGLGGVELGELVALVVGGDIESGKSILTTDKEGTLDDGVVGLAVHGSATEEVLAAALKTGEETTWDSQYMNTGSAD
jgi:hypothetical protein